MRTRWSDTAQHEVEFRDGLHGALVWALGIIVGAGLAMATAGSVARTGAEVAGKATAAATVATANSMDLVLDTLLRPAAAPQPQQGATPPPPAAAARPAPAPEATRAIIGRILANSLASGSVSGENRAYLVQLVSQQTGLPPQEVETRVNNAMTAARDTADKARRGAILAGLVTAISLVVSFAAAWWAALQGGHHRDNSIAARFDFAPRRQFGAPRP
jgi:hypothetical protein